MWVSDIVKKIINSSLALVIMAVFFVAAPSVFAATTPATDPIKPAAKTTDADKADAIKKRDARLSANKLKFTVKLAASEETRLKGVCKAAQEKTVALEARAAKSDTERSKVYTAITDELTNLIPRLKAASVDTTEVEKSQSELTALIKTYTTDYAMYKVSLKDLSELDCVADPVAFKSTLETARADRVFIAKDTAAIRAYVSGALKTALKNAAAQLDTSNSNETTAPTVKENQ